MRDLPEEFTMLRVRPLRADWNHVFEKGGEEEPNVYSGPANSSSESSSLSSFESADVKHLFLSENCLSLERAAEIVEEFLGPATSAEHNQHKSMVGSWEQHDRICF